MQRRIFLAAMLLPAAVACAPSSAPGGASTSLPVPADVVIAFPPSSDPNVMLTRATPIAEYLSRESGLNIRPYVATTHAATIDAMASKKVDVALLAPAAYVVAKDRNAAEVVFTALRKNPVTGSLDPNYSGAIIVPASSTVTGLSDLKSKKIAFVDATSASGYIYPVALFLNAGINPLTEMTAIFLGIADAAVLAVYEGKVDAAATFDSAEQLLKDRFPDVTTKLRTLATTGPIPNDVIAFRNGLAPGTTHTLKAAITKMASDSAAIGKDVAGKDFRLLSLYRWDGVADAKDSDFDVFRQVARGLGISLNDLVPRGLA